MTAPLAIAGPTLAEVEAARVIVQRVAQVTPMETSRYLAEVLGAPVLLKCENLQRTGSYKIRGAYHRISQLSDDEKARGVVAASAGNHAQGVAFAARELGIPATIFMPIGVALPKLQATRYYGAEVVLRGHTVSEPLAAAQEFAERTGAVYIPPFDHADVIAGQGTLGLELLEQAPELQTVIVPIGGGGLISGVASVLKRTAAEQGRRIRVIGVQAANAAAYPVSLAAGAVTEIAIAPTIADGIAVAKPGRLNFEIVRDAVDEVVTVDDDDIARAMLVLLERAKMVVEPAGAVGVAAILTGQVQPGALGGQHRPAHHGARHRPRPRRLGAVSQAAHPAARPAGAAGPHERDHRRAERERRRGAAHPPRHGPRHQPGRARAAHRDPRARARRPGAAGAAGCWVRPARQLLAFARKAGALGAW